MKTNKFFISAIAMGIVFTAFTACSDDDEGNDLPPIGGYDSADEVGASSLLAYWPLDGDGIEDISNTAPSSSVGTSWESGIKGQGVKLNAGYLNFPTIPALSASSGSITVSVWAKLSNTKQVVDGPSHISEIFNIAGTDNGNGYIGVLGETHGLVTSDSIQVKGHYETKKADGTQSGGDIVNMVKMEPWMITYNENPANPIKHVAFPNKIGGQWAHIVYVFDGATAKNMIYVNGVNVSNTPWVQRNDGVTPFPLVYATTTHPIIGARANFIAGTAGGDAWNQAMTGSVDEIRVYDKVLIPADITALYELEKAGR